MEDSIRILNKPAFPSLKKKEPATIIEIPAEQSASFTLNAKVANAHPEAVAYFVYGTFRNDDALGDHRRAIPFCYGAGVLMVGRRHPTTKANQKISGEIGELGPSRRPHFGQNVAWCQVRYTRLLRRGRGPTATDSVSIGSRSNTSPPG
jgi:hypothetical protein